MEPSHKHPKRPTQCASFESRCAPWPHSARGFSLVELLIVIAVIVILLAMVLPAIGIARSSARQKQCASNQIQIWNAWTTANSRDARRPVRGSQWHIRLGPYLEGSAEVLLCPDDRDGPLPTSYGISDRAWRFGANDAGRIVLLDSKETEIQIVGRSMSQLNDTWPAQQAPRHFQKQNVAFFDGHVEICEPRQIDPRYCDQFDRYWRPVADANLALADCINSTDIPLPPAGGSASTSSATGSTTGSAMPPDTTTSGGMTTASTTTGGTTTGGTTTSGTTSSGGATGTTTGSASPCAANELATAVGPRFPVGPKVDVVPPAGAVRILVGDDWQAKINANPAGTTFAIAAGTHNNVSIRPKDHQEFWGEFGAICDGGGIAKQFVCSGSSVNNLIKNLRIRNYANPLQDGCIGNLPASRVEDCEITGSNGFAVRVGAWIKRSLVHHNHQGGLSSFKTTGAIIEDCEFSFDNWQNAVDGEMTAKLWYCNGAIVRYCHFHDNQHGIWFDANNIDCEVHNCLFENNQRNGIYYEISYRLKAHHNLIRFANRIDNDYAGIRLQNSQGCELWENTISDCYAGIQYASSERSNPGEELYGEWITRDNFAHDNRISRCSRLSQNINWGDDFNPLAATANNRFDRNHYCEPSAASPFGWGSAVSWPQWRAAGQDGAGTFTP